MSCLPPVVALPSGTRASGVRPSRPTSKRLPPWNIGTGAPAHMRRGARVVGARAAATFERLQPSETATARRMTSQVLAHAPPAALPTTGLAGAPKLFALLMASILLDVGGSFGLKYSATLVVVGYLALNARAIRLPVSTLRAEV